MDLTPELLQAEGGELLQAVQHLVTQALDGSLPKVSDWSATLKGFARLAKRNCGPWQTIAANRVRSSGSVHSYLVR